MKNVLARMWKEEDGVLSFEWVLLVTLLTIGIVSGLAGARDAIIDELGDVAQAMLALDQSYTIDFPLAVEVHTIDHQLGERQLVHRRADLRRLRPDDLVGQSLRKSLKTWIRSRPWLIWRHRARPAAVAAGWTHFSSTALV